MKHKKLVIAITCLVFVMVMVLCFQQLFSIRDITVVYSVTKEDKVEDVLSFLNKYKKKNIFFTDTEQIRDEIADNNYLKVVSIKKKYPNEIVINLEERLEKYYYIADDGVYYFDKEYYIVRKSDSPDVNNLIMIDVKDLDGNRKNVECNLKGTFTIAENLNSLIDRCLFSSGDNERNILSAEMVLTSQSGNYRIHLHMKEGVVIEIRNAVENLEQKTEQALEYYINLEESRKMYGTIVVDSDKNGAIISTHTGRN